MQGEIKKRRGVKGVGVGAAPGVGRLGRQRPVMALRHPPRHHAKDPPVGGDAAPLATPPLPPSSPSRANIEILTNPSPFAVYALVRQTILDLEAKEENRIYWNSIVGFQGATHDDVSVLVSALNIGIICVRLYKKW